jgi:hypothetical protein
VERKWKVLSLDSYFVQQIAPNVKIKDKLWEINERELKDV